MLLRAVQIEATRPLSVDRGNIVLGNLTDAERLRSVTMSGRFVSHAIRTPPGWWSALAACNAT
jgi:hypothetical protein